MRKLFQINRKSGAVTFEAAVDGASGDTYLHFRDIAELPPMEDFPRGILGPAMRMVRTELRRRGESPHCQVGLVRRPWEVDCADAEGAWL